MEPETGREPAAVELGRLGFEDDLAATVRVLANIPSDQRSGRAVSTGLALGGSCPVAHRNIKHRMVYRHSLLGDSEPRRDRHPSFRVADHCPDEFLRTNCRE
jgi:hypothetical protein